MDRNIVSARPHSAELRHLQRKFPARSTAQAATGRARGASPGELLLLLLGTWAASWAALLSLSSWLRWAWSRGLRPPVARAEAGETPSAGTKRLDLPIATRWSLISFARGESRVARLPASSRPKAQSTPPTAQHLSNTRWHRSARAKPEPPLACVFSGLLRPRRKGANRLSRRRFIRARPGLGAQNGRG